MLHARAKLYADIRTFFFKHNVLEVETPLLCPRTVTDPHIESFKVPFNKKNYFLQTSPEYAMKRMLCDGAPSIFQITKAFRMNEVGAKHNPEFSMLEWYRLNFDHHQLIHECDALLQFTLNTKPAEKISYRNLFLKFLSIDPLTADKKILQAKIAEKNIAVNTENEDKDFLLNILLSHCIEPTLGFDHPVFIFDFPVTQAALAKIRHDDPPVAERFELYINGVELANGFHELTDAAEQEKRFLENQQLRKQHQQFVPEIDDTFINALKKGLPSCAGVAIGLDRLLMLKMNTNDIRDVIYFPCPTEPLIQ